MSHEVNPADALAEALELSQLVERSIAAYKVEPPQPLLEIQTKVESWIAQLEDILDAQEADDVLADAREHGAILWAL